MIPEIAEKIEYRALFDPRRERLQLFGRELVRHENFKEKSVLENNGAKVVTLIGLLSCG